MSDTHIHLSIIAVRGERRTGQTDEDLTMKRGWRAGDRLDAWVVRSLGGAETATRAVYAPDNCFRLVN